jgi:cell division protein FtsL
VNMVEIENQIQEKSASISALQYEIEHRNDPETIESIAREKLGLKLPGERVFYVGN